MTGLCPRWLRSGRVVTGLAIITVIGLCAILAPWLAPHDPNEQNLIATFLPSTWAEGSDVAYPLGTDSLGRDVLSRLIYGARVAMLVAVVAATLAALLGTLLGLVAGFFGGG